MTDHAAVREKVSSQQLMSRQALTKFMAKTQPSNSFTLPGSSTPIGAGKHRGENHTNGGKGERGRERESEGQLVVYHMSLCSLIKTSVPIRIFIKFMCVFARLRFKSRHPTGTCFPSLFSPGVPAPWICACVRAYLRACWWVGYVCDLC